MAIEDAKVASQTYKLSANKLVIDAGALAGILASPFYGWVNAFMIVALLLLVAAAIKLMEEKANESPKGPPEKVRWIRRLIYGAAATFAIVNGAQVVAILVFLLIILSALDKERVKKDLDKIE